VCERERERDSMNVTQMKRETKKERALEGKIEKKVNRE